LPALRLHIGAALLLALATPSLADTYVGGDSLGVGVGMAGKSPSVADESVRIKSKLPLSQIAKVPKGSTLFMSLGTNDAVGGVLSVDDAVSAIVTAAADRDIKLVWLGPPCVFKNWDDDAKALDDKLSGLMPAESGVTYVSMRGDDLCTKSLRAKDGVHFTMKGYRLMWNKAVAASGGVVEIAPEPPVSTSTKKKIVRVAVAPVPMPTPGFRRGGLSFGAPFPMPLPRFHRPGA
jgi:lysophospholipase L1-like esterase